MDTSRDGELRAIFIPIYHTHGRRTIPKSSTSHIIAAESSRALVKKWTAGEPAHVADSAGLEWGPRTYIFH